MSFDTTYKLWVAAKDGIKDLIKKQNVMKKVEALEERPLQFQIYSEMYILYAELVNKLSQVYLHTLQVQKRDVVRNLLDGALNRYMELKNTLKEIEMSEYVYMDKSLMKKKLNPADIMIWRSPNFLFRRPPDIQNIHYGYKIFASDELKEEFAKKSKLKIREALIMIQMHERARKARIYQKIIMRDRSKLKVKTRMINYGFTFDTVTPMSVPVKRTVYSEEYVKKNEECIAEFKNTEMKTDEVEEDPEVLRAMQEKAARVIQRHWGKYKNKKVLKMKIKEEEYILNIKFRRPVRNPKLYEEEVLRMYQLETEKKRLDEDFRKLIEDERTRIFQERAPWIMEDITEHIRGWFQHFYDKAGALHPYPDEVKGGTVLVVRDETMDLPEFAEYLLLAGKSKEEKKKAAQKAKAEKKKEKAKEKKLKLQLKKKLKAFKDRGAIPLGYELQSNKFIMNMEETIKNYGIDWRFIDEYLNKEHAPIKDWVTEDELVKAHQELRLVVDEYMRTEWELLQKAWCLDEGKKYKPAKQKKAKAPKKKKVKKGPPDLTAGRTLDDLYYELDVGGFIDHLPHKTFEDYIAEFNFFADSTRDVDNLTTVDPSLADIKILVEECVIGMGEIDVIRPKSVLFMGPFQSGKRLLCNIIASETDSLVINLSPERTAHLSEGDLEYFLQVVMKVAKAFEPTLLYFEEGHRVFWKKVPPEKQHLKPLLLEPVIQKKIIKPIKKEDRIMVLATSEFPWDAKGKFKKLFQKIILIPKIDYGSAFLMWLNALEKTVPDYIEDYQISALTKCMKKYTTGDVLESVKGTLTGPRKAYLNIKKLDPTEFMETFLDQPEPKLPIVDKILNKYDKWYKKSNKLAKKRAKFYKMKMALMKKK